MWICVTLLAMVWMLLVLLYGLFKGGRDVVKKKCLEKNGVVEVLFFYTLVGFIMVMVIPGTYSDAVSIDLSFLPIIFVKSLLIFLAWILSFMAIQTMPVSLYGIIDMSRVIFATLMGVIILRENLSYGQIIGLPLVLMGLFLLRVLSNKNSAPEKVSTKTVVFALISCLLNAISGFMDKVLMKDVTSTQLQAWYMFFLLILYTGFLLVKRTKFNFKSLLKNYWIYILAVMFVVADKALFVANSYPQSKLTVMTLIKQSACFVTIALGKIVFKEKNIGRKCICAAVILAGILLAALWP